MLLNYPPVHQLRCAWKTHLWYCWYVISSYVKGLGGSTNSNSQAQIPISPWTYELFTNPGNVNYTPCHIGISENIKLGSLIIIKPCHHSTLHTIFTYILFCLHKRHTWICCSWGTCLVWTHFDAQKDRWVYPVIIIRFAICLAVCGKSAHAHTHTHYNNTLLILKHMHTHTHTCNTHTLQYYFINPYTHTHYNTIILY